MGKRLKLKESLEKNVGKIGEKKVEKRWKKNSVKEVRKKIETVEKKFGQNLKNVGKIGDKKVEKKIEKKVSC